jgi:hypothetical protein
MNINKAIACGLAGNELSKQITGTSDVSASRTAVATSSGVALGIMMSGAAIGVGMVTSPVTVPLAISSGLLAGIASLCD